MLSDFMDQGYEKTLRIAAKKHDLTGIRVYDPVETKLPNLGIVPIRDAETGAVQWIFETKKIQLAQSFQNPVRCGTVYVWNRKWRKIYSVLDKPRP
mgnify:CR=1 FL=1